MALGFQQVGGGEAPGGGGIEVHGDDPLGGGGIAGRLGLVTEDPIGDEDVVDTAEGRGKAGERRGRIRGRRKVGDGRFGPRCAAHLQVGGDGGEPVLLAADQQDLGAFGGIEPGGGLGDAGGAAEHHEAEAPAGGGSDRRHEPTLVQKSEEKRGSTWAAKRSQSG